jgi:hypothetical protein
VKKKPSSQAIIGGILAGLYPFETPETHGKRRMELALKQTLKIVRQGYSRKANIPARQALTIESNVNQLVALRQPLL